MGDAALNHVLDMFAGTGTTCAVAQELGRDWLGIELNPEFARMAEQRLGLTPRLLPPASNEEPRQRAA